MNISGRGAVPPFIAMDVMAEARRLAAEGRDIVHLEVGEPFAGAPRAAREALAEAMADGRNLGYTQGAGLPALREAIARRYRRENGIDVAPERIVITGGSSCGFSLAFLGLFEPGQRIAIADPGYPCYRNVMMAAGLRPCRIAATLDERYQPTPERLGENGPLDGLLVASPANPTGTMLDRAALSVLVAWCRERGVTLIADEIYHGLTYGERAVSVLELTDEAVVLNSFSKYHAMTGWRVGWMVVPERLAPAIVSLQQNLFICAPHASQVAALGALSEAGEAEVAGHLALYARNREAMLRALPEIGFTDLAPADGAFYVYAGLGDVGTDSRAFCRRLLQEAGVATTPGLDFDPDRGHATLRFSIATDPERLDEGLRRLRAFVG